jgi:hypothetical protein
MLHTAPSQHQGSRTGHKPCRDAVRTLRQGRPYAHGHGRRPRGAGRPGPRSSQGAPGWTAGSACGCSRWRAAARTAPAARPCRAALPAAHGTRLVRRSGSFRAPTAGRAAGRGCRSARAAGVAVCTRAAGNGPALAQATFVTAADANARSQRHAGRPPSEMQRNSIGRRFPAAARAC